MQYERAKTIALERFLQSEEGSQHFQRMYPIFLDFYKVVEQHGAESVARKATHDKIEKEHLGFPEFGVWLLQSRVCES